MLFAGSSSSSTASSSPGSAGSQSQGQENRDPLPNPWAPPSATTSPSSPFGGSRPGSATDGFGGTFD
jgi:ubiquilin